MIRLGRPDSQGTVPDPRSHGPAGRKRQLSTFETKIILDGRKRYHACGEKSRQGPADLSMSHASSGLSRSPPTPCRPSQSRAPKQPSGPSWPGIGARASAASPIHYLVGFGQHLADAGAIRGPRSASGAAAGRRHESLPRGPLWLAAPLVAVLSLSYVEMRAPYLWAVTRANGEQPSAARGADASAHAAARHKSRLTCSARPARRSARCARECLLCGRVGGVIVGGRLALASALSAA